MKRPPYCRRFYPTAFCFVAFLAFSFIANKGYARPKHNTKLRYSEYATKIIADKFGASLWVNNTPQARAMRSALITLLDSAEYAGLEKEDYHYHEIINADSVSWSDSSARQHLDDVFTDALLSYCMDLYSGNENNNAILSDEISGKYRSKDLDKIIGGITAIRDLGDVNRFLNSLEPTHSDYLRLKLELRQKINSQNTNAAEQLAHSMNIYRWIHHFQLPHYIEINIPAAQLHYFRHDSLLLQMAVVAGKPATPTPLLGTWCNRVVLYPYWNVPTDIGNKELLTKCKKHPESPDLLEFQLVDKQGKVWEINEIDFHHFNEHNFPYTFRQTTGCENALGVIKFELTDSLSIYLHDTNFKNAFLSAHRYFSHGCVRLEHPLDLANYLTDNQIDSNLVLSCIKNQDPVTIRTSAQVPVFIVYNTAIPTEDSIQYLQDVYGMFR